MWLNGPDLQQSLCGREDETKYLKVSDVGEEEADEWEGQRPFSHGADDVSRVTLERWSRNVAAKIWAGTKWNVSPSIKEQKNRNYDNRVPALTLVLIWTLKLNCPL